MTVAIVSARDKRPKTKGIRKIMFYAALVKKKAHRLPVRRRDGMPLVEILAFRTLSDMRDYNDYLFSDEVQADDLSRSGDVDAGDHLVRIFRESDRPPVAARRAPGRSCPVEVPTAGPPDQTGVALRIDAPIVGAVIPVERKPFGPTA